MHSDRLIAQDISTFGPFSVAGAARTPSLRAQPMDLGDADAALLSALIRAGGAPVDAATLATAAGSAGALWDGIATLNTALAQRWGDAGYIAHYPEEGYALVLAGVHAPQRKALPTRMNSIVARDDVVAAIEARLHQRRFVTIAGAGGIGKTTVAAVLAARLGPAFADGVCYVDLAPLADARLLPLVLAAALGIGVAAEAPWQALGAYLRDKRVLVLLDSCEHMIEAAANAAEQLLRAAPALHLLATSREPLLASGEWLYRLGAMALPPPESSISAARAAGYPGIELFVARAGTPAAPFVLDAANVDQVCALCHRLDGIPLAIELAAARVATLGLARLAEGLAERLLHVAPDANDAPARHRSLGAMLDWSYDLLPAQEQRALVRLALFRGEFTLAAAVAVLAAPCRAAGVNGDSGRDGRTDAGSAGSGRDGHIAAGNTGSGPIGDIDPWITERERGDDIGASTTGAGAESVIELVSKSLLTRRETGDDIRYRLLDTTRAYAGAKLDASGERQYLLAGHAHYLCRLLGVADGDWMHLTRSQWIERYVLWVDDIRVALDWAFSADGDRHFGMRLAAAAFPLGHQASLTAEFGERIRFALAAGGDEGPLALVLKTQMQALLCSVHARRSDSVVDAMRRIAEDVAGVQPDCPPPHYRIALASAWWASAFLSGQFQEARTRGELLTAHAAASGDTVAALVAQRAQAQTMHFLGHHAESRRLATHVLANAGYKVPLTYNPSQIDVRVSMRLMLSRGAWIDGHPERARAIAAEGLAHAEADAAVAVAQSLAVSCIPVALWCGQYEQAGQFVARLTEHAARYSFDHWGHWAAVYADVLAARSADADVSAPALARLLAPALRANDQIQRDQLVTFDARLLGTDSLARAQSGVTPWCVPEVLRAQALQHVRAGALDAAVALLERALALAAQQGALAWQLRSAITLVQLERQRGAATAARAGLQALLAQYTEGHDTADLRAAAAIA